jgi:hypothetical protein
MQQRYDQAETHYRKALDIYRQSDHRAASDTATRLSPVFAALGQHHEAVRIFRPLRTCRDQAPQFSAAELRPRIRQKIANAPEVPF